MIGYAIRMLGFIAKSLLVAHFGTQRHKKSHGNKKKKKRKVFCWIKSRPIKKKKEHPYLYSLGKVGTDKIKE